MYQKKEKIYCKKMSPHLSQLNVVMAQSLHNSELYNIGVHAQ